VPAVPEQENDGLVPPLKILRKRLNGVYRADGFSGPTRRYVLIVALLVGLASLPTLAAITAGTDELDGGTTGAMDVPFLPPPSSGPVVPVRPSPSPSTSLSPSRPAAPDDRRGIAGEQKTMPPGYAQHNEPWSSSDGSSDDNSGRRFSSDSSHSGSGSSGSRPAGSGSGSSGADGVGSSAPGEPVRPAHRDRPGEPARPADRDRPVDPGQPVDSPQPTDPARPGEPARPVDPEDRPASPGRPLCHERGKCGSHESWHHRPDWSRHRHCEESTHRAHWSHHREGRTRSIVVDIVPTGRHGHHAAIREQDHDAGRRQDDAGRGQDQAGRVQHDVSTRQDDGGSRRIMRWQRAQRGDEKHASNFPQEHRSDDRSEHSRRSTMTERPQNIRPARTTDRTQNSRRTSEARWDEPQSSSRSYHGSHRAPSMHRAADGQSAAHDRSSRVGRHHAGHHEEHSNRR
jgi:hypothetical protein